jgi:hypothetical protein
MGATGIARLDDDGGLHVRRHAGNQLISGTSAIRRRSFDHRSAAGDPPGGGFSIRAARSTRAARQRSVGAAVIGQVPRRRRRAMATRPQRDAACIESTA